MFIRKLKIDLPKGQSAFLWGARQVGKSTYMAQEFASSLRYDFLKSDLYLTFLKEPYRLREELLALAPSVLQRPIILDEVQRIPLILNEVHWLIENRKLSFLLCGSSARKLRRGQANLLGGRAWRFEMLPLIYPEVPDLDLLRVFNHGLLPAHYQTDHPRKSLKAYVIDYLTEEIKAEGLSRNLAAFAKFLEAASFSHGQLVQYKNIASDCGVDAKTVKEYFEILKDTHIGSYLLPLAKKNDRKAIQSTPKFYFFDPGIANYLSKTTVAQLKGSSAGVSFESYLFHELKAYRAYADKDFDLRYWRAKTGHEVDFIVNEEIYIEAKISENIQGSDLKGLKSLMTQHKAKSAFVVCLEKRSRVITTSEGHKIRIIPWKLFLQQLWEGSIF